jgi:hypothetical protein
MPLRRHALPPERAEGGRSRARRLDELEGSTTLLPSVREVRNEPARVPGLWTAPLWLPCLL